MAYCFQNPSLRENISLVFHLGGGTFDASIMVTENGVIEVNSTSGDSHIGGVDFDAMVHHSIDKDFQMRYNGDLTGSTKSMRRLFMACERAKRALSSQVQVSIELDKLFEDVDYHTTMTRAKFEDLNADLFKSIFGVVEKVLQESQYSKTSINDVILVGGSSRIPKVQQMLQEFFTSSELTIMAPDSAAYGAALEAAILSGIHNPQLIEMLLVDVTPHTLGIETAGGVMTPLIRKNTLLPTNRTQIFSTFEDNQPTVTIKVYEGEETLTKNCTLLGKFSLSGIPPAPKGDPHINVKFCINTDGALDVTASDKKTGHSNKVTVTNTNKRGHTLLANPGEDEGKYSW
ncbi:heat-shock protein 70 [Pelomyxa schiedti]|nr:heat-shock protein 70 [Pelomyxa schiedti]